MRLSVDRSCRLSPHGARRVGIAERLSAGAKRRTIAGSSRYQHVIELRAETIRRGYRCLLRRRQHTDFHLLSFELIAERLVTRLCVVSITDDTAKMYLWRKPFVIAAGR